MLSNSTTGVLFALASAAVWGSGDYCGGRAARDRPVFSVLTVSAVSGMAMMVVLGILFGESWPSNSILGWATLAGASGAVGLVSLYRGLSFGSAALVAPIAAVISAAIPVLFAAVAQEPPGKAQLCGFGLALAGIWLSASAAPANPGDRSGLQLAVLAGLGFGGFYVLIARAGQSSVFFPLAVARAIAVVAALTFVVAHRQPFRPMLRQPMALLAGMLDAGGNVLYVLAQRYTRLDVAAVLSSLYPVSTIYLAWWIQRERISSRQALGIALCLGAVGLIAAG